ncbi:MAG: ArsR/SmtB family transcription factor [Candidatus Helarchaeota archaeon]
MNRTIELKQLKTLAECKGDTADLKKIVDDLSNSKTKIENNSSFSQSLKMYKALSEKNRLLIFEMLLEREEMCICEFTIALGKSQPTISHHLQKLEDANLVVGIKSGKFIHYRIKKESVKELFSRFGMILDELT